jgi:hypothetical protein
MSKLMHGIDKTKPCSINEKVIGLMKSEFLKRVNSVYTVCFTLYSFCSFF